MPVLYPPQLLRGSSLKDAYTRTARAGAAEIAPISDHMTFNGSKSPRIGDFLNVCLTHSFSLVNMRLPTVAYSSDNLESDLIRALWHRLY